VGSGTVRGSKDDLPDGQSEIFFREDWTVESALMWLAKFDFWRNGYSDLSPKDMGPPPRRHFGIYDLITDIANANSTLGFYVFAPGSEK
jgi:hypothetical protein